MGESRHDAVAWRLRDLVVKVAKIAPTDGLDLFGGGRPAQAGDEDVLEDLRIGPAVEPDAVCGHRDPEQLTERPLERPNPGPPRMDKGSVHIEEKQMDHQEILNGGAVR